MKYLVKIDQYNQPILMPTKPTRKNLDGLENAQQACQRLNISAQTLYAYVSRNLLRTTHHPDDSRKRLYYTLDINQLINRQKRSRSRHDIANSTVDFGEPSLQSHVSNISDGVFFYRGENAVELSKTNTIEQILELLCQSPITSKQRLEKPHYISKHRKPLARFVDALANQVAIETSTRTKYTAYQLLELMACNAVKNTDQIEGQPIHQQLAKAWSTDPRAPDLIRRALVLSADHELNASTYASRITASAGANLPACLLTGVSTLSGNNHGGLTQLCVNWMLTTSNKSIDKIVLSPSKHPPGFGHRLYPNGDPRAVELLRHCSPPKSWQRIAQTVKMNNELSLPTLDFALATLEYQLKLPKGAGFSIFAVGRTVGWLAHCFEQRKTGALIRPRAYT